MYVVSLSDRVHLTMLSMVVNRLTLSFFLSLLSFQDSVASLLVAYFGTFGNRACFWRDCGRYALALDGPSRG
jgi:hypothetical protein